MKLRDQAYQAFIDKLLDRTLKPGQFVTQRDLMQCTGMPLAAVREMIPHLEADGLLAVLPQRGMQIVGVDLRLVREAFQLREIVETAAIAVYARTAPDAAIAEHRAALDRAAAALRAGVTPALLAEAQAADWAFHTQIVAHLHNGLLSDVHRVNVIRIRAIMGDRTVLSDTELPPMLREHDAILRAVERRDAQAAVAALRTHVASARQRALGFDVLDTETRLIKPIRRKA